MFYVESLGWYNCSVSFSLPASLNMTEVGHFMCQEQFRSGEGRIKMFCSGFPGGAPQKKKKIFCFLKVFLLWEIGVYHDKVALELHLTKLFDDIYAYLISIFKWNANLWTIELCKLFLAHWNGNYFCVSNYFHILMKIIYS